MAELSHASGRREPSWAKVIFLWVIALGAIGFIVLLLVPETPPACATDIDVHKAQVLFDAALQEADLRVFWIEGSLTRADIGPFVVTSVYRSDEDNWSTYFVRGEGTLKGAHRVIIAIGNGCGLGELQDLGDGKNYRVIPPSPSLEGNTP